MSDLNILFEYIKKHLRTVLYILLFAVIQAVVLTLYRLPREAVWYGAAICIFAGALFAVPDFIRFRRRHILLERLVEEISFTDERLPEGEDLIEKDLIMLILKLREDKKQLSDTMNEKYSDMKDYYAMWAHQIKTPVAAMRLILDEEDSDRGRELSEYLMRIEQYADMVMCYIRLESPSGDYVIKKYPLDHMIKQSVKKFSRQFIRKRLRLVYDPSESMVLTDEKWFVFVLEQVISNALKYTKSGSIHIYEESPSVLCIRDTGTGISPEDIPYIFSRGYTGYNGRTDKRASGIGLYLCKRICSRLGHDISAQSELGKGTVIKIDMTGNDIRLE